MADRDYEVGYAKPPRHSRFKPGQSGNPKGRRKGQRGLKTDLEAELESKHTIHINQQPITDTKQRLMVKTLVTRAATGDVKAQQVLLPLLIQILGIEDRGVERRALSAQDEAILSEMLETIGEEAGADKPDGTDNG